MSVTWVAAVVAVVVAFVGGSALGSIISWQAQRGSEHYADIRHLRDLQAKRVRAAFKPLLRIAQTLADVASDLNHPLQPADTTERDKRLNDAITSAMKKYATARIALRLEPHVSTKIDPLFADVQRAYLIFRNSFQAREEMRRERKDDDPSLTGDAINTQAQKVIATTDTLNVEMRAFLERLDEPLKKPWYVRD